MALYGGIEAGGTKFVCAVGTGPHDLRAQVTFPTTTPDETLGRVITFFREQPDPVVALGIGSFGPIDLDRSSPTYGYITSTPKQQWRRVDICGRVGAALGVPVAFDTDVNAAALGEQRWGAGQGIDTFVYLTIGTGIGGGVMVNNRLVHGLVHPELGHVPIPHDRVADPFAGVCDYHGDCLEGLANGPAMAARWGQPAETLPPDHAAWALEAHYLALGLVGFICTLSPKRIIMGGGVMQQPALFPLIRAAVPTLLNGYIDSPVLGAEIDEYICPPGLGTLSGLAGALALAEQAHTEATSR